MTEPKLRFKADDGSTFPDWEEKKLGDVCDPLTYGMNAAAVKFDGENKYIRITDIDDEGHQYLVDEPVSPDGKLDDKYLVSENDILLARTGASVGKSYIYDKTDGKLYYAGFLIKAHVKSEIGKFIFYQTLTDRYNKWVKVTSMRSGQPGINANEYSDFMVSVPSLPEQQKIADFLSMIDTVIEKQEEIVSAWEERKKGVMQKLFSQEVRFKADDGSEFPEWEEKKFSEIFEKTTNKNTCYGTDEIISVANMYYKEDASVSNEDYLKTYNVMLYGDIAFEGHVNKEYSHGRFVLNDIGNGIVSHIFDVFHPKNLSLYSVGFWKEYIRHEPIMGRVLVRCTKSSTMMRNLVAKEFLQESVPVPCLAEQQKIADCLSALDDVIEKQKATLAAWEEMKKGLLQQMFV